MPTPPNSAAGWIVWVAGVIVTGGGLRLIYDVFFGRGDRRKVKAEGSVMMVESANKVAQDALDQVAELSRTFAEYRTATNRRWHKLDEHLRRHSSWDRRMVVRLEKATGESVEEPPPLYVDEQ